MKEEWGLGVGPKWVKGIKNYKFLNYKIKRLWECNVEHGEYSQ